MSEGRAPEHSPRPGARLSCPAASSLTRSALPDSRFPSRGLVPGPGPLTRRVVTPPETRPSGLRGAAHRQVLGCGVAAGKWVCQGRDHWRTRGTGPRQWAQGGRVPARHGREPRGLFSGAGRAPLETGPGRGGGRVCSEDLSGGSQDAVFWPPGVWCPSAWCGGLPPGGPPVPTVPLLQGPHREGGWRLGWRRASHQPDPGVHRVQGEAVSLCTCVVLARPPERSTVWRWLCGQGPRLVLR